MHIAGKEGQLDVLQELHRTSISDDEDKHDAETLFMARDDVIFSKFEIGIMMMTYVSVI